MDTYTDPRADLLAELVAERWKAPQPKPVSTPRPVELPGWPASPADLAAIADRERRVSAALGRAA